MDARNVSRKTKTMTMKRKMTAARSTPLLMASWCREAAAPSDVHAPLGRSPCCGAAGASDADEEDGVGRMARSRRRSFVRRRCEEGSPGRGDDGEMEMGGLREMERGDFFKRKKKMERGVASGVTAANAQLTAQSNGMAHKGCNIKTSGIEGMNYFSMAHRG